MHKDTTYIYNLNKKLIGLKQFLKFQNNLIPEAILRNLMHIVQFLTHLRCLYFSTAHNNVHLSILWVIIYKKHYGSIAWLIALIRNRYLVVVCLSLLKLANHCDNNKFVN